MQSPRRAAAPGPAAVLVAMALAVVLVVSSAGTAVAVTVGATGGRGQVPLGLAALGAVLGVVAFGIRQWWERPGRGRH